MSDGNESGVVLTTDWMWRIGLAIGALLLGAWRLLVSGQLKRIDTLEKWRDEHEKYTAAKLAEFATVQSDVGHLKTALADLSERIDSNAKDARQDRAEILAEIRAVRAKVS